MNGPSSVAPGIRVPRSKDYLRIATEEAYAPAELLALYRALIERNAVDDPGFVSSWRYFLTNGSPRTQTIIEQLQDIGTGRIRDMDATGIDKQLLSITAPGVQIFDADTGSALAITLNDQLAEAVARHPDRFAGLAAVAPQDPAKASREIERAVRKLGLKGVIINSHTHDEYLDDPKFWPIFEAAEALEVPLYLHPTSPSRALIQPLLERGLDGAIYGFAVETGMHALALIVSGVFDRFPRLKLVLGHLGEGLPFWLGRIDFMHRVGAATRRYKALAPLQRKPSEYIRENFYVTTSGMATPAVIAFCQATLGIERVLYAMDYPYQFIAQEVLDTESLAISVDDKRRLFQTNAERLFRLLPAKS